MSPGVVTSAQASIQQQAREWLIRMDGDAPLSADEVAALRKWAARSPAHQAELQRIAMFWNRANVLTELAVPMKRQGGADSPSSGWVPYGFGLRSLGAAAMVCVAVGVAAVVAHAALEQAVGVVVLAAGDRILVVIDEIARHIPVTVGRVRADDQRQVAPVAVRVAAGRRIDS